MIGMPERKRVMSEQLRDNYYGALRIGILLILEVYIVLSQSVLTGASAGVLLLLALLTGAMAAREIVGGKWKWIFYGISVMICGIIVSVLGRIFLLPVILLCYEFISGRKSRALWYLLPLVPACIPDGVGVHIQIMVTLLMGAIYVQHDFIVESYRKQTREDIVSEQQLKRSLYEKENEMQQEMKRGMLFAENRLLEERAQLSQTLHDRLGHSINGSVYQLEAVKVLMEKDADTAGKKVQAVIDQLREGMDEIRAILRKERPPKYRLAILQLEKLCEDCRDKGVETTLVTEGDLAVVSEKYLEVILDNAYEAVSNALKYAGCTKIEIRIHVMNRLVRCSIADNGIGCAELTDGMGISGMRRRMREINGILDFDTSKGFVINMLLPLERARVQN